MNTDSENHVLVISNLENGSNGNISPDGINANPNLVHDDKRIENDNTGDNIQNNNNNNNDSNSDPASVVAVGKGMGAKSPSREISPSNANNNNNFLQPSASHETFSFSRKKSFGSHSSFSHASTSRSSRSSVVMEKARKRQVIRAMNEESNAVEKLDHEELNQLPVSLHIFSGSNPFRLFLMQVMQNWYFQQFILFCIIVNAVLLGVDQPTVNYPDQVNTFLVVSDIVFTCIFAVEMVIKIIALGFVMHEGAYLRGGWNMLDFFIVVISVVNIAPINATNVSALRVVRVLRPLRSVSRIPELRILIQSLLKALPQVVDNILLFLLLLVIFSVIGLQVWSGNLSQACYAVFQNTSTLFSQTGSGVIQVFPARRCGGDFNCLSIVNASVECAIHENIFYPRYLNFDNFGVAMVYMLKLMVLDNWSDDFTQMLDSIGTEATVFLVFVVFLGFYCTCNLFFAVLSNAYGSAVDTGGATTDDVVLDAVNKDAATWIDVTKVDPLLIIAEEERLAQAAGEVSGARVPNACNELCCACCFDDQHLQDHVENIQHYNNSRAQSRLAGEQNDNSTAVIPKNGSRPSLVVFAQDKENEEHDNNNNHHQNALPSLAAHENEVEMQNVKNQNGDDQNEDEFAEMPTLIAPDLNTLISLNIMELSDAAFGCIDNVPLDLLASEAASYVTGIVQTQREESNRLAEEREEVKNAALGNLFKIPRSFRTGAKDDRNIVRCLLGWIVGHKIAEVLMLAVTTLNTISLALDHHDIDDDFSHRLDIISLVCTVIFAVEIILKLIAFGFVGTLVNPFNALDFIIVAESIIQYIISGSIANSGLAALRVLRTLRVLKLLTMFPSLQLIVRGVLHSMGSIGYLSFLILLHLYVFAILGMQIFGTDYADNNPDQFLGFGTTYESFLIVFTVITGDSWTDKMRSGMDAMNANLVWIPVAFFVLLFFIGNFVLTNLMVAIILDHMQELMDGLEEARSVDLHPPMLTLPPAYLIPAPKNTAFGSSAFHKQQQKKFGQSGIVAEGEPNNNKPNINKDAQKTIWDVLSVEKGTGSVGLNAEAMEGFLLQADFKERPLSAYNGGGGGVSRGRPATSNTGNNSSSLIQNNPNTNNNSINILPISHSEGNNIQNHNNYDNDNNNTQNVFTLDFNVNPDNNNNNHHVSLPGSQTASANDVFISHTNSVEKSGSGEIPAQSQNQQQQQNSQNGTNGGGDISKNAAPARVKKEHNYTSSHYQNMRIDAIELEDSDFYDKIQADFFSRAWLHVMAIFQRENIRATIEPSLGFLLQGNCVRTACLYLHALPLYNLFIFLAVIVNVVFLALDSPYNSDELNSAVNVTDIVVAVIFCLDMATKIIAFGFWSPKAVDVATESLESDCFAAGDFGSRSFFPGASASAGGDIFNHVENNHKNNNNANAANVPDGGSMLAAPAPQVDHGDDAAAAAAAEMQSNDQNEVTIGAYMTDFWNIVDGLVTIFAVVGLFAENAKFLRSLRTFRLLSRIDGARIILEAIIASLPMVLNGLFLSVLAFMTFGVLGVQLFKGSFYTCNDANVTARGNCTGQYFGKTTDTATGIQVNALQDRAWTNAQFHFDDFPNAVFTLFVIVAGDGWSSVMYDGMSVVGEDIALRPKASMENALFFVAAYVVGNIFCLNMIIGILLNFFQRQKEIQDGSAFLTDKQRKFVRARNSIEQTWMPSDEDVLAYLNSAPSRFCHRVLTYTWWEAREACCCLWCPATCSGRTAATEPNINIIKVENEKSDGNKDAVIDEGENGDLASDNNNNNNVGSPGLSLNSSHSFSFRKKADRKSRSYNNSNNRNRKQRKRSPLMSPSASPLKNESDNNNNFNPLAGDPQNHSNINNPIHASSLMDATKEEENDSFLDDFVGLENKNNNNVEESPRREKSQEEKRQEQLQQHAREKSLGPAVDEQGADGDDDEAAAKPENSRIETSIAQSFFYLMITLNFVINAIEYQDMPYDYEMTLLHIEIACLAIFSIEWIMKFTAYGTQMFTSSANIVGWFIFDTIIIIFGWVSIGEEGVRFLSFLRALRLLRLIRGSGVANLLLMLLRSFRQIVNVFIVLAGSYFVFAVAGVAFFGTAQVDPNSFFINENRNFKNVGRALLVLFQASTTDAWGDYATSLSSPDFCTPPNCISRTLAAGFFMIFLCFITWISLQMFVAILIEVFDQFKNDSLEESDPLQVGFLELRKKFDEIFGEGAPDVKVYDFIDHLHEMPVQLTQFANAEPGSLERLRLLGTLPLPVKSDMTVSFRDIVLAFAFKHFQIDVRSSSDFLTDVFRGTVFGIAFSAFQVQAARIIQTQWTAKKEALIGSRKASFIGK